MNTIILFETLILRAQYPGITFTYNKEFFRRTQIGQIRWGQLVRKEREPSLNEIENLCKVFRVDFVEFLNSVSVGPARIS